MIPDNVVLSFELSGGLPRAEGDAAKGLGLGRGAPVTVLES